MSGSNFTLDGTENLKRIFQLYPEMGYRRPVNKGFSKAAQPVRRAIIAGIPSSLAPIRKAVKVKAAAKFMSLQVGFFANQGVYINRKGKKWDPFQLAYWFSYGTYSWRTSLARLHVFATPRKTRTSKWQGGVKPLFFVERAWDQTKGTAQKIFEQTVDEETMKFLTSEAK
jgi:hypothetical protein